MGISEVTKKKLDDNLNKALEKETPESWDEFLEKQGKTKPVDEVAPKFKVGDWVIRSTEGFKHNTYLVTEVKDYYICEDLKGRRVTFTFNDVHKNFKLWTIQDAKDGDVLVAEIDEEPNDFIYIFKEYNQNLGFWSHCYLDAYTNKFHEGIYHNNLNVGVPATKEQRDMFFQKMHEAGYEWDFEVKKLNKIEKKLACSEEEKQLLLKDLCARLPHGMYAEVEIWNGDKVPKKVYGYNQGYFRCDDNDYDPDEIKPFLRPMSSMTEDEKTCLEEELCTMYNGGVNTDYESFGIEILDTHPVYGDSFCQDFTALDWLNAHHFDYRNLIEKDLALEAPDNMYN